MLIRNFSYINHEKKFNVWNGETEHLNYDDIEKERG